jgi:hypothetical protein
LDALPPGAALFAGLWSLLHEVSFVTFLERVLVAYFLFWFFGRLLWIAWDISSRTPPPSREPRATPKPRRGRPDRRAIL